MRNLVGKTSIMGLILLLTLSLSAQQGDAQGRQQGKKGQCNQHVKHNRAEKIAAYLELTEEQQENIKTLKLDHQRKMLPLKNELGEKQAKMKTLKTAEKADMNAINSLIDEMAIVKTKMAKDRAAMHQEIRKILNDEQRVKFDMHAGKKGGKGHGQRHGKNCQH